MALIWIILTMFIVDFLLRKLLRVKHKGFFGRYEHFNKNYALAEKYTFIIFLVLLISNIFIQFVNDPFIFTWALLTFIWLIRGIQEWKYDKENKEYIFSWIGSTTFLIIIALSLIGLV
ncbi:DUF4181 domain-containing protein [Metabacillus sp. Hm71]|uniref:DUF4181 domain-containing protein n=1 Tax=Metabacillus sp. Hm71 TaxID=3450743 RepID=UPI003F4345BA